MSLKSGTHCGPYEITAAIGAGGMGEVYRGHDATLNRDVAIKVLPAAMSADPERLARFRREAQVLASLNHPNIAHVHGFEAATLPDGSTVHILAMELVEGEDLSERLRRGAVPVDEALAIAKQIAEGLEEAHERGIIHRDLKPANVKVTPEGKVKILDFGLAKALDSRRSSSDADPRVELVEASHSPTMSRHMTEAGMILGTAGYMSPEQARGKVMDKRTDIWSFGVVLFEMLSGARLFARETLSDTLAAVLKDPPPFAALPKAAPQRLRALIERCLERDLKIRLRDIGEARVEIAKIEAGAPESSLGGAAVASAPARPTTRLGAIVIVTAGAAILLTSVVMSLLRPIAGPNVREVARVSVALPDGDEIAPTSLRRLALSDDGSQIAYAGLSGGVTRIYVRKLSEAAPKPLEGTEGGTGPFFSPDGKWLGFFAGNKLSKIATGGGGLQTLADAPNHRGGTWGDDGYVYFVPSATGGIWRVAESGGVPTEISRRDEATGEVRHSWPHFIAGKNTLLFGMWTGPGDAERNVAVQVIGEPNHHILVRRGDAPYYSPEPSLLIYAHLGQVFAVPWHPSQTHLDGAVPVAAPERLYPDEADGSSNHAVALNGTLAYLEGGSGRDTARLVWVDRDGNQTPVPLPARNYETAAISPDGTRAIVQIREDVVAMWVFDLSRNTLTPIGNSPASSQAPVWTADGRRVIYRSTRKGLRNLYWRPADGSGSEEALSTKVGVTQTPTSTSPGGQWLAFNETATEGVGQSLWVMRLEGDRAPRPLFPDSSGGERNAQFSPDGRWIAYEADVSTRSEIYVSPFPGPGPRYRISTEGGEEPLWSHDGRELFFQSGARLMGVDVTLGAAFSSRSPHVVHEGRFLRSPNRRTSSSLSTDGKRFLRIQRVEPERAITRIDLVQNWLTELGAKAKPR